MAKNNSSLLQLFTTVISIMVLGLITGYFISWWTIVPVAFIITATAKNLTPSNGFFRSFLAGFLLWSIYAAILNSNNDGVLSSRIGSMLNGGGAPISSTVLIVITGLIGAILAGLGGLTGRYARAIYN